MKFLFDLLPVILFFIAYKITSGNEQTARLLVENWPGGGITAAQAPILFATAITIVATFGQIAWTWLRHRKVDTMLWISLAIIATLGGATLLFHNPTFMKWKPTALYWIFSSALTISVLVFKKNFIRNLLEKQIQLPDAVWQRLNTSWAIFFALMGVLNLYVAYRYSEPAWVNFKLFGATGLMFAFIIGQSIYLSRYLKDDAA